MCNKALQSSDLVNTVYQAARLYWPCLITLLLLASPRCLSQTLTSERAAAWRAQIRSNFFIGEAPPELDAVTHRRFEPDPAVRAEAVTYTSQFGLRVPAILYLPKTLPARGKVPGVIVVNGHGGDKYSWYAFYTGVLYARAGAAVLTFDPVGEGERNAARQSGTRAHDKINGDERLARRLAGLFMSDVMQAVSYLGSRPEVDANRIGAVGYSLGSFVLALTGAVDLRLRACVLAGGGNLDGPDGYWDNSKPMCQGLPYRSLGFLGDRPAAIYALHGDRGATLIYNGLADAVVNMPNTQQPFFDDLRQRTARLRGRADGLFDTGFAPAASHRPYFVTRPVAAWLEKQLDFPYWTERDIATMPETHISEWAAANAVAMDRGYLSEDREGGTQALGTGIPNLTRADLGVFSEAEWHRRKNELVLEQWLQAAQAVQ
jgi:dienelactone hydrolase